MPGIQRGIAISASKLSAVVVGTGAALCLVTIVALYHLRRDALDSQSRELDLLALALTDEIDRDLQEVDEGLHAIRSELQDGRLAVTGEQTEAALKTRSELIGPVTELWLVDGTGRVLAGSDAIPAPSLTAFSPELAKASAGGLAVSSPFLNTRSQAPMVGLAIRYAAMDSRKPVSGWILAGMPAELLLGAFSVASPAEDARMAVFRSDGAGLAGAIDAGVAAQEADSGTPMGAKGIELRRFRDGSEHLVSMHRLTHLGLEVVLMRDQAVVLKSWRAAVRFAVTGLVLLAGLGAVSVYLVLRAERRRAAAQQALLAQGARASRLESLGTLAGGVAHDFNNVLTAIVGFGEMAQDAARPDSPQASYLERMLHAASRGKALVERVLTFSRGGGRTSVAFELQPVVAEVLDLLAPSLHPGVELQGRLAAAGLLTRGDPSLSFAAIMNVCTNANQAMPSGGPVLVGLERVQIRKQRVLSHTILTPGAYLVLTVTDRGAGISSEVMDRLFQPFFSTRGPDAGTGLGLAVVYGVMAQCRGAIDVRSSPGHGASFTLYFPECHDAQGDTEEVDARSAHAPGDLPET